MRHWETLSICRPTDAEKHRLLEKAARYFERHGEFTIRNVHFETRGTAELPDEVVEFLYLVVAYEVPRKVRARADGG